MTNFFNLGNYHSSLSVGSGITLDSICLGGLTPQPSGVEMSTSTTPSGEFASCWNICSISMPIFRKAFLIRYRTTSIQIASTSSSGDSRIMSTTNIIVPRIPAPSSPKIDPRGSFLFCIFCSSLKVSNLMDDRRLYGLMREESTFNEKAITGFFILIAGEFGYSVGYENS